MMHKRDGLMKSTGFLLMVFLLAIYIPSTSAEENIRFSVHMGQSRILEFTNPVTRVAIANPTIADATVISSHQILVTGKSAGTTNFIVWSESKDYVQYKLIIQKEPASHQIMLEVRFVEVNKIALREFGVDFLFKHNKGSSQKLSMGSFGGKVGQPSDPLGLGNTVDFFFSLPSKDFSTIMKALEENNLMSILATPNLSTISGSEASFLAGGEFPIPIVSGSMGMQTVTIQFKEYGVKLKFLPTVLDSNIINIKVAAEVSNLDFDNGITLSGFQIPSLVTRKTETTVELEEGEVFILGGLLSNEMTETVSKIPFLGSIPILGRLFSSRRYQNKESELLITLSPSISRSVSKEEVPDLLMKSDDK